MKHEQTYYEQVRDAVERLGECDTSDAQGIIGAWEIRNGGTIMEDLNMDKAEEAGTQPEDLARAILGKNATPIMDEFLITVNAASALLDMDPSEDDYTPDPIDEGMDLAREAAAQVEEIREHYDELRTALKWALDQIEDDLDLDHQEVIERARQLLKA